MDSVLRALRKLCVFITYMAVSAWKVALCKWAACPILTVSALVAITALAYAAGSTPPERDSSNNEQSAIAAATPRQEPTETVVQGLRRKHSRPSQSKPIHFRFVDLPFDLGHLIVRQSVSECVEYYESGMRDKRMHPEDLLEACRDELVDLANALPDYSISIILEAKAQINRIEVQPLRDLRAREALGQLTEWLRKRRHDNGVFLHDDWLFEEDDDVWWIPRMEEREKLNWYRNFTGILASIARRAENGTMEDRDLFVSSAGDIDYGVWTGQWMALEEDI